MAGFSTMVDMAHEPDDKPEISDAPEGDYLPVDKGSKSPLWGYLRDRPATIGDEFYLNGPRRDPTTTVAAVFVAVSKTILASGGRIESVVNLIPASVNACRKRVTVSLSGPGNRTSSGRRFPQEADCAMASQCASAKTLVSWEAKTNASGSFAITIKVIVALVVANLATKFCRLSAGIERQMIRLFSRSCSARNWAVWLFKNAMSLAFAAFVFGCVIPSPASPAIRTNADNRLILFSQPIYSNHVVNSLTDSPATPIKTAPSATYPHVSQKEMSDINNEISGSIASYIRFQHVTAWVNGAAGFLLILALLFGKRGRLWE